MIHYLCPNCQAAHASIELIAGMTVICKKCKQPIQVPQESTAPAPVAVERDPPPSVPAAVLPPTLDLPPEPPAPSALATTMAVPIEPPAQPAPPPEVIAAPTPRAAAVREAPALVLDEPPPRKRSRVWLLAGLGIFFLIGAALFAWILLRTPQVRVLVGHDGPVWCVAGSPDGQYVLSGGAEGTLILWSARGREIRRFEGHTDTVTAVAFDREGRFMLSGSFDRTMRLWDVAAGSVIAIYPGHEWAITSVGFSVDGMAALSASADQTARVWDILNRKEAARVQAGKVRTGDKRFDQAMQAIGQFPLDGEAFTAARFTPDATGILTVNTNRLVALWNTSNGDKKRELGTLPAPGLCAALSLDGQFALAAGGAYDNAKPSDCDIHLWNAATGVKMRSLTGHTASVTGVTFSPDGTRALSASRDRTVRLWDIATSQELRRFEGHGDSVTSVVFSADGGQAISGSLDKTVRLWRLP